MAENQKVLKWITALQSGKYNQAQGILYDGKGYCCLGVADKVCFNAVFSVNAHNAWKDDLDRDADLSDKRAQELDLLNEVTDAEMEYLNTYDIWPPFRSEQPKHRQDVLIRFNDKGFSFDTIAAIITTLNWHKNADKWIVNG